MSTMLGTVASKMHTSQRRMQRSLTMGYRAVEVENRISKDINGNDISGISKLADLENSKMSNDVEEVLSNCAMNYNKDDSLVHTEIDKRAMDIEYD